MNKVDKTKFLPEHFTEEDKLDYELLCDESRRLFRNIKDDWLIHIAVIAHINERKGLGVTKTDEEIAEVMSRYDLRTGEVVLETPYDPDFRMEDTLKPIIEAEVKPLQLKCDNIVEEDESIQAP